MPGNTRQCRLFGHPKSACRGRHRIPQHQRQARHRQGTVRSHVAQCLSFFTALQPKLNCSSVDSDQLASSRNRQAPALASCRSHGAASVLDKLLLVHLLSGSRCRLSPTFANASPASQATHVAFTDVETPGDVVCQHVGCIEQFDFSTLSVGQSTTVVASHAEPPLRLSALEIARAHAVKAVASSLRDCVSRSEDQVKLSIPLACGTVAVKQIKSANRSCLAGRKGFWVGSPPWVA